MQFFYESQRKKVIDELEAKSKEGVLKRYENQQNLLEEDIWCVHKYLDDCEIERLDEKNQEYSIVGRIKRLEMGYIKRLSTLESSIMLSVQGKNVDGLEDYLDARGVTRTCGGFRDYTINERVLIMVQGLLDHLDENVRYAFYNGLLFQKPNENDTLQQ